LISSFEAEGAVLNAISLISFEEVVGMSGIIGRIAMCAISSLKLGPFSDLP